MSAHKDKNKVNFVARRDKLSLGSETSNGTLNILWFMRTFMPRSNYNFHEGFVKGKLQMNVKYHYGWMWWIGKSSHSKAWLHFETNAFQVNLMSERSGQIKKSNVQQYQTCFALVKFCCHSLAIKYSSSFPTGMNILHYPNFTCKHLRASHLTDHNYIIAAKWVEKLPGSRLLIKFHLL